MNRSGNNFRHHLLVRISTPHTEEFHTLCNGYYILYTAYELRLSMKIFSVLNILQLLYKNKTTKFDLFDD